VNKVRRLSQTMPRSVSRIRVNRSRWPTHCIAATMKAMVKLMKLGRTSEMAVPRVSCASSVGT